MLKSLVVAQEGEKALSLFREMSLKGAAIDSFSCSFALKACLALQLQASLVLCRVRQIHARAILAGLGSIVQLATTLVASYSKIGEVSSARMVFDEMPYKNVFSWSAMIACYANNGRHFDALAIFKSMMTTTNDSKIVPNSVTMVSSLQACAGLSALAQGKLLHGCILRRGLDGVTSVPNALISLYAKCGRLELGRRVFDAMILPRDEVSWNSLISMYGIHGLGKEAIFIFEEMIKAGIKPSPITFVSLLGACSHGGFVEEGSRFFLSMWREHKLEPQPKHYACMVDLLGRAGRLDEASKIVDGMQIEPGATVWASLLGACRMHGNVGLAEKACSHLFELEPWNAGNYILLSDVYAGAELRAEADRVRKLLAERGLQKLRGCSCIEVRNRLCSFASAEELNQETEEMIRDLLIQLLKEAEEKMGYAPNIKDFLFDGRTHSEIVALAFGLIAAGEKEVIRITKNLRLCEDCHSFTKLVSKLRNREILVRDVNRFHSFRDGLCSKPKEGQI